MPQLRATRTLTELAKYTSELLRTLEAERFGIVITDLNMSPVSGMDILRAAKAIGAVAETSSVQMAPVDRTRLTLGRSSC